MNTSITISKIQYIIYYAYTSVQSVIDLAYDRLGPRFRFVYIYACIAVFFVVAIYRFSVNKDLYEIRA